MDTPQNILYNFSGPGFFILANFVFLPFCLFGAYYINGILPFASQFFFLLPVTLWWLQPTNPFAGGSLFGGKKKALHELDESALRVLSFFGSRKPQKIVVRIFCIFSIVLVVAWYVSNFVLPKPMLSAEQVADPTFRRNAAMGEGFLFAIVVVAPNYMAAIFGYALKHWDEIQKTYKPWPLDRPYYHPLKFWMN